MNFDKTFCASQNCKNDCGRQMTKEMKTIAEEKNIQRISYAYFCGEQIDKSIEGH